ncbi:MAG TPA: hypothetical protein VFX82_09875 [Desulfobacterales bacterium]|nr:hypothetical protein [Desulfobacterales bacterium]
MLRPPLITRIITLVALAVITGWLLPGAVLAVQEHGAPEGIYSHQGAHVFFTASMGLLIFWLRQRRLVREPGWRCIQYAALFFILWNIDAFTAHFLDEQSGVLDTVMAVPGKIKIEVDENLIPLAWLYYMAKLDHVLCVPAMLFLYAGLRRLLKDAGRRRAGAGSP